ncbi:MAG: PP2C family protein-serine/threonine phosphatase [Ignavibacteria bacterium]
MSRDAKQNEPGFFKTLESDMNVNEMTKDFSQDMNDIIEFYVTPENKAKLNKMNPMKRGFFSVVWILKSMILKLNPMRRVMLLAGAFFIITAIRIEFDEFNVAFSTDFSVLGCLIIIILLMLELKDKLLAKDELVAGRKIQEALMPEESPYLDGWTLWLYSRPANEVSGDLVDFFYVDDDRATLFVSDVAGKGLHAALMTSKLQAIIKALAPDYKTSELISKVNSTFYKEKLRKMFASLFYVEIIKGSNTIEMVNAGHLPAYILRDNQIKETPHGETALGLIKNADYSVFKEEFKEGNIVVIYSDGITDAKNRAGEFYGNEKMKSVILQNKELSAKALGEQIVEDIFQFTGQTRQNDDISIIVMKKM